MYSSLVAKNTKRIIKEKGLFQKAVAKQLGIKSKTLNDMLNNRKIIKDTDIIEISKTLGVEPNELFKTD